MGFFIKGNGSKCIPTIICDSCHEEITNWKHGNVEFREFPSANQIVQFSIFHKRCSHSMRREYRWWMPLENYLGWWLWNNDAGKKRRIKGKDFLSLEVSQPMDFVS